MWNKFSKCKRARHERRYSLACLSYSWNLVLFLSFISRIFFGGVCVCSGSSKMGQICTIWGSCCKWQCQRVERLARPSFAAVRSESGTAALQEPYAHQILLFCFYPPWLKIFLSTPVTHPWNPDSNTLPCISTKSNFDWIHCLLRPARIWYVREAGAFVTGLNKEIFFKVFCHHPALSSLQLHCGWQRCLLYERVCLSTR